MKLISVMQRHGLSQMGCTYCHRWGIGGGDRGGHSGCIHVRMGSIMGPIGQREAISGGMRHHTDVITSTEEVVYSITRFLINNHVLQVCF